MKMKQNLSLFLIYMILSSHIFETNAQNKLTIYTKNNPGPLSFISLNEKESIESKLSEAEIMRLETSLKEMFLSQLQSKKRKRYTQDGRICAAAFVQDGKTFFDCTSTRSPDGELKNREWCYVDPTQKGDKIWDYCKPIMDYDKVREANQNLLKEITIEARKTNAEIEKYVTPAQNALDELKRVKEGQADLDNKVNLLLKDISTSNNNLANLYSIKTQWENEENLIINLAAKIEKKKQKLNEKEESNRVVEYYDTSTSTIKSETISSRASISGLLQQRKKEKSTNCAGMLLYEEENEGDGLIAHYYDNEAWLGDFKERKDPTINFFWTGTSPIKGVNPNNFSVKWEGYLKAPYTGEFIFAVECDDGASLILNNELIITHKMHTVEDENKERTDKWLNSEAKKRKNGEMNLNKKYSKPMHLSGGSKFKITLLYFHSIHDHLNEDEDTFIRLFWSSDEIEEVIIPKRYFYSNNSFPPLKITDFDPHEAVIRKLNENDLAFKNSDTYVLQDIPPEYYGAITLKYDTRIKKKSLKFRINSPTIVYAAYLSHYPNPLPSDFENTQQYINLLQIDKNVSKNQKKILSKKSGMMNIFKKSFSAGKVKIPLASNGLNVKGVPLVLFFGFDPSVGGPITCGGKEINISNPSGEHFKECSASSEYPNYSCSAGFSKKMFDEENSMWATKGEGIGAWIEIKFKSIFQITKFEYLDRRNPGERNSKLELLFENGETQKFNLKNSDEITTYKIDPIMTSSIRFTIKGVYGTINNGGSFKIYGVKCANNDIKENPPNIPGLKSSKNLSPLFKSNDSDPIKLNCRDSISNSNKFDFVKKSVGSKVLIYCPETCAYSDYSIYGDLVYSKDSVICKSAYHSQKLKYDGGKVYKQLIQVWLVFQTGKSNYRSQLRNGFRSQGKSKSNLSITFEKYNDIDEIILEPGNKVDYIDSSRSNWLAATIIQVTHKSIDNKIVKISIDGTNENVVLNYPDKNRIQPCGNYVKGRECKGSRRSINKTKPIKIRFMPKESTETGDFLVDNGFPFGTGNKPFGWSKDISNRIRTFSNANKPELSSLIEFPPSPKSKYCKRANSDVLCENITFSVKVGSGRYFVRLYIGDPEDYSKVDLKINDKFFVKNQKIPPNKLKVYEGVVEAKNEYLTIESNCQKNCDHAMSKLNAIEIIPFKEKPNLPKIVSNEVKLSCGHAYIGGRCDKGPDVLHCIFNDPSKQVATNCNGNLIIMNVPDSYKCRDQIGKYKCVKRIYDTENECEKYCVQPCTRNQCVGY